MRRVRSLLVLVLLACVLVGGAARAQSAEVKKYLNVAITLYENLEYEQALKQLQKARVKAAGPDDEMRIGLLEACVLADMGKEEKALAAFKTAFGNDLDAKLPVEVSPKVQAVAEKARASVRKVLAPRLEAEKAEAEKAAAEKQRQEDEKKKAEGEARLAEQRRREDEERQRSRPPPAVKAVAEGPSARALAWVPGAVGLLSAGGATAFFAMAGSRYQALTDGSASPADAAAFRDSGKTFTALGWVFSGVAAAGLVTAVVMFAVGAPRPPPVAVLVTPQGALVTVRLDALF